MLGAGLLLSLAAYPAAGQAPAEFYGKNGLRVIVGNEVGGSYDLMGRLTSRHIVRHIPGNPSVVVQNMPGGGSLLATNHIYNVAPQDGSVLCAVVPTIVLTALFKEPSARYDPTKLHWIGNAMDAVSVPTLFHTSGAKSLSDIKSREIIMGSGGISSMDATNAYLFNALLGTKIKVVTGYAGGDAINLAMERGEIDGRASQAWSAWKAVKPDWLRDGKLIPLLQLGLKPIDDPMLKNVPLLVDLVANPADKALAESYTSLGIMGRPMVMGPGVPPERVAAIRQAYKDMMKDPAFLADAAKQRVDLNPMTGEELQAMVATIYRLDAEQIARLEAIIKGKSKG